MHLTLYKLLHGDDLLRAITGPVPRDEVPFVHENTS